MTALQNFDVFTDISNYLTVTAELPSLAFLLVSASKLWRPISDMILKFSDLRYDLEVLTDWWVPRYLVCFCLAIHAGVDRFSFSMWDPVVSASIWILDLATGTMFLGLLRRWSVRVAFQWPSCSRFPGEAAGQDP